MRRVVLLAALLASHTVYAEERYITVGADAVATLASDASIERLDVRDGTGEVAVVVVDDRDLDDVAHAIHEAHDRCGGFMLHDSLAEAQEALRPARDNRRPIDYTLDRAHAVQRVLPALDKERIRSTIGELVAMKSRYYKSPSGAAASRWLADRWRSFSGRDDVTIELVDHGYPQKSVIMTIPGTTRAHEVVVIGGHLDSISLSGFSSEAPGADDDASGIATLTEIARVLLAADYRPARTIKFMAYAAEEVGLRGSQAIAKDFAKRGVDVVGALQLDMTNYQGSDKDIWLMKDFTSAAQNTFLISLIETYVGATWGLDACGYACSDHASWTKSGVPASMPFESRMNQRNKQIHTARDTLETSGNNADHALKFARLGAAYAIELAKGDLAVSEATLTPVPAHEPAPARGLVLATLALLAAAAMWLQRRAA